MAVYVCSNYFPKGMHPFPASSQPMHSPDISFLICQVRVLKLAWSTLYNYCEIPNVCRHALETAMRSSPVLISHWWRHLIRPSVIERQERCFRHDPPLGSWAYLWCKPGWSHLIQWRWKYIVAPASLSGLTPVSGRHHDFVTWVTTVLI